MSLRTTWPRVILAMALTCAFTWAIATENLDLMRWITAFALGQFVGQCLIPLGDDRD